MTVIKTESVQDAQQREVARTLLQIWQTLHPDRPSSALSHCNICGAMEALYDEHANRLYYYLLVMSDPNTAADVTQKVWLKLVESPQLYKAQGQFQAWLFTVGHRMLIDEIRRDKRWTYDDDVDALPDEHEEFRQCDDFHQALKQLPFAQREAFSLQQEDFSLQDIATICNVPVETVKTRLRYARDNLRKLWKPSA